MQKTSDHMEEFNDELQWLQLRDNELLRELAIINKEKANIIKEEEETVASAMQIMRNVNKSDLKKHCTTSAP